MFVCPQMIIVRFLIIGNMRNRHIYTRTERRGKGLAAGETERERERERVCERWRVAENRVGVHCKNGCWRATNYFGII